MSTIVDVFYYNIQPSGPPGLYFWVVDEATSPFGSVCLAGTRCLVHYWQPHLPYLWGFRVGYASKKTSCYQNVRSHLD